MIIVQGHCLLKKDIQFTQYFWGDLAEIAGKTLSLIEQNPEGACLCLIEGKGLIDVDPRDIERVIMVDKSDDRVDALEYLLGFLKERRTSDNSQ